MIWILGFYWISAGIAFYGLPPRTKGGALEMLACLVVGGFFIPAKILQRLALT